MANPDDHLLLLYEYVADMHERREPVRDAHMELVRVQRDSGHLLMAGGFDPLTGGALVFRGVERDHVERFVAEDPYVRAGLVVGHRIETWRIVRAH